LIFKASNFTLIKDAQIISYEQQFGVTVEVPQDEFINMFTDDLKTVCSSLVATAESEFIFRTKAEIALDKHTKDQDVEYEGTKYLISLMGFKGDLVNKPLVIVNLQGVASIRYECRVRVRDESTQEATWEIIGFNVRVTVYIV
jgi:hypothetical protein